MWDVNLKLWYYQLLTVLFSFHHISVLFRICLFFITHSYGCTGHSLNTNKIGDGKCHDEVNIKECLYDLGDCCQEIIDDSECTGQVLSSSDRGCVGTGSRGLVEPLNF